MLASLSRISWTPKENIIHLCKSSLTLVIARAINLYFRFWVLGYKSKEVRLRRVKYRKVGIKEANPNMGLLGSHGTKPIINLQHKTKVGRAIWFSKYNEGRMRFQILRPHMDLKDDSWETQSTYHVGSPLFSFKDVKPFVHSLPCDEVPVPCLSVHNSKFYLGLLPREDLILFHVLHIVFIHHMAVVFCRVVGACIRDVMHNDMNIVGPPNARMKNIVKVSR